MLCGIFHVQSWREVAKTFTEDSVQSVVTLKVTSDISAVCNATNDMGVETKTYNIKSGEGPI